MPEALKKFLNKNEVDIVDRHISRDGESKLILRVENFKEKEIMLKKLRSLGIRAWESYQPDLKRRWTDEFIEIRWW